MWVKWIYTLKLEYENNYLKCDRAHYCSRRPVLVRQRLAWSPSTQATVASHKYVSVFAMHPQSTRGSRRYVPVTLGHTDHSQETVRTFRASRQANEMWLRQCCQRASSCSIHTATTGVWRVSHLQPSACVCACMRVYEWVHVCVGVIYIRQHIVHMQTPEWELYTICAAVWACGCSEPVHHSGKDNHKLSDGKSAPRWNVHVCVCLSLAETIRNDPVLNGVCGK